MPLASFIATTDLTDNAAIAAAFNALPTRYARTEVTLPALARIMPPTPASIAVLDALIADATMYVSDPDNPRPTIGATLQQFVSGTGALDLGNPIYRAVITQLIEEPGPLTAEAAAAILSLANDTHGGTKTADDVAAVKAEAAADVAKVALRAEVQPIINAAEAGIDDGTITTLAQWRAEVGA